MQTLSPKKLANIIYIYTTMQVFVRTFTGKTITHSHHHSLLRLNPQTAMRLSSTKFKTKKEFHLIGNVWSLQAGSWRTASLLPITTFRRGPLSSWWFASQIFVTSITVEVETRELRNHTTNGHDHPFLSSWWCLAGKMIGVELCESLFLKMKRRKAFQ